MAASACATAVQALTAAELAFFHREGYVVAEDFFSDADLQPAIEEIQGEVNHRAQEQVAAGKLTRTYAEYGFERQLTLISRETDAVACSIWNGNLAGPAFFNLIRNPKLLDLAESLCGPELIASSVFRLRPKIPGHRQSAVPWHQDSGYLVPYCDKALVITVWLPFVDANRENGCLWVIPRAHRGEVLRHVTRPGKPYLEIPSADLPSSAPVCVPVKKGGALFMTNLTPHASFDNSTDLVRWSMDLRYQSAALPTNAKITRLPGEAVAAPETETDVPPACYPPEADFLVRSRQRPGEVVSDPQEFQRIRRNHVTEYKWKRWE